MQKKKQLKNGLKMVVSPMPGMASVSLGVWIGVGGRYESKNLSGMSHLVEHMLFKGTHTRSAEDLKRSVEGIGGAFNGFTSDEITCYMVKVPAKYFELGLDILADMVFNAKLDKLDIEKEKFVVCEEIKMYKDQPADYVMELLARTMWPDNALGRPLTGTTSTVKGFKKSDVAAFRNSNYHPANMSVVATGKIPPSKFFRCVSERFSKYRKKKCPTFKAPAIKQRSSRTTFLKSDTKQAHIAMGFPVPVQNMRERFTMKIMNVILGGNMSSRLFDQLREKYGLCYDISSSYKRHSDVGELIIHSGVDTRKVLRSFSAILDELKKIKDEGVTADELVRAKEFAKGQFLLAMEGTATRMLWLGDRLMVHKKIPEVKDILEWIDEISADEIRTSCEKIFDASKSNLAVIGGIKEREKTKIKKAMDKL